MSTRTQNRHTHAPLGRVATLIGGVGFPVEEQGIQGEEVAFYKVNALGRASGLGVLGEPNDTIDVFTARRLRAPLLDPGSIVMAKIGAALHLARIRITSRLATIDNNMLAVIPRGGDPRFLSYALQSSDLEPLVTPGAVPSLDVQAFRRSLVPNPTVSTQAAIARFLDRETAQIDAFIAKNEELITLLSERRDSAWDALYQEATLAGPVLPLRRIVASIVDGPFGSALTSAHYSESGTRVIRLGNIGINQFKDSDRAYIPSDYATTLGAHSASAGDVIVAGLGDDRMPLGRACVLPEIGPAIVKADCYRLRPAGGVESAYLAWIMSAPVTRGEMRLAARGSTRERLNTSVVLDVRVPVPDPAVQASLVERFGDVSARCARAALSAQRAIELARERRAALISAAVTGKIDVGEAA